MTGRRQTVLFLGALAVMLGLATAVQVVRDRTFAHEKADERLLYLRSGTVVQKAALSYDAMLADLYWIRALQHYGRERLKPGGDRRYDLLYPLLELHRRLPVRRHLPGRAASRRRRPAG